MACVRLLTIGSFALCAALLGQQPDAYPGNGPPTSGTPGPRKGQVPSGGSGPPAPPLGKKKPRSQAGKPNLTVPTASKQALLVKLGTSRLIVLADDKRVLRYEVSPAANFFRMEGKERKPIAAADLKPGDRLTVDSAVDEEGLEWAIQLTIQHPATDEEKARVAALDQTIIQARFEPIAGGEPEPDDRPRMRRKNGQAAATPPPKAEAPTPVPPAAPQQTAATRVVTPEPDRAEDEFGSAPVMKRGKPVQTASNRTAAPASPAAVPTPAAAPPTAATEWKVDPPMTTSTEEHPMLAKAREAVRTIGETMPNYICQQITTRYSSTKRHKPEFHAEDIISAEVVVENGRERYRNLQLNFKPTKKSLDELGGARSTGEFYTVLADVFDPSTAADFRYSRPESIAGRISYVFNLKLDHPRSHWTIQHPAQSNPPPNKC
jgi:hypothetical protein